MPFYTFSKEGGRKSNSEPKADKPYLVEIRLLIYCKKAENQIANGNSKKRTGLTQYYWLKTSGVGLWDDNINYYLPNVQPASSLPYVYRTLGVKWHMLCLTKFSAQSGDVGTDTYNTIRIGQLDKTLKMESLCQVPKTETI